MTNNQIKYISSLKQKKFRDKHNKFIVEGDKLVKELLNSHYDIENIYAVKEWAETLDIVSNNIIEISAKELKRISLLKTPNKVLAVADIKTTEYNLKDISKELSIVIDDIQDPGNFGTIMRTADWFGIKNVFCSSNSVDVFNPKVVQATMGAIFRVNIYYINIADFIKQTSKYKLPVYGTYLEGENIYQQKFTQNGIIVFGNEGAGISDNISSLINNKIHIPSFGNAGESLNIASAVAIVCSEFRRGKTNKDIV